MFKSNLQYSVMEAFIGRMVKDAIKSKGSETAAIINWVWWPLYLMGNRACSAWDNKHIFHYFAKKKTTLSRHCGFYNFSIWMFEQIKKESVLSNYHHSHENTGRTYDNYYYGKYHFNSNDISMTGPTAEVSWQQLAKPLLALTELGPSWPNQSVPLL